MRKHRASFALLCGLLTAAAPAQAQQKEDPDDFVKDVVSAIFGPNWNLFLHGGTNNHGRLLLQRVGAAGERALRGDGGYHFGIGAGVDILLRTGIRLDYSYGMTDLMFETDNGDGSTHLDIADVGEVTTHSISIELLRYMLPSYATLSPYAMVGLTGVWYGLEDEDGDDFGGTVDSQFRTGASAALGLKVKLSSKFDVRFEAHSASVRSPFAGNESFVAFGGLTIDEPTRVNKRDVRMEVVYNFGRPDRPTPPRARASRRR
jgi:opacity protein-like surface antigen